MSAAGVTAAQPGSAAGPFRFCPYCGASLESQLMAGRARPFCRSCGFVQYRNPVIGVAVILRRGGAVLLGRRAGSHRGSWCIPCGYVEWDEDVREAARREFEEETGLSITVGGIYAVHSNFHNPRLHTVGVWFEGLEAGGALHAGDDLDDVGFFRLDALPQPLAFPTDRLVLERLRAELAGPTSDSG